MDSLQPMVLWLVSIRIFCIYVLPLLASGSLLFVSLLIFSYTFYALPPRNSFRFAQQHHFGGIDTSSDTNPASKANQPVP